MTKRNKKSEFLQVYKKALGNVSVSCRNYGIERQTFYNWYNSDARFKEKCDEVKELRKDFIESAIDKRIAAGDTTMIIFAAKTICKDRGYVEKVEQNVNLVTEQPLFNVDPK